MGRYRGNPRETRGIEYCSSFFLFFRIMLGTLNHLVKGVLRFHQLGPRAAFTYRIFLEYEYPIKLLETRETVRDHYDQAVALELPKSLVDISFTEGIKRAGRFVKD